MKGKIHSFQSFGTVDGPGVRFVVFLHGCNLSCGYCHNIDVCRGDYTEYTAEEVVEKVLRYRSYFGEDGGITVSGGEPLLQAPFLKELFTLCREKGLHIALDTSGSLWNEEIEEAVSLCDLVLLDIKMTNEDDYQKHIGCPLSEPLAFLEKLEERSIPYEVRHVVVEGINDTEESILELKRILQGKKMLQKIDLLPFRKICEQKYQQMQLTFPFACYPETKEETIAYLYNLL